METSKIIKELKDYCKTNNDIDDNIVYKSFQVQFLDGYFGTVINHKKKKNEYEVFSYLKNKYEIASPLQYKEFTTVEKANEFFDEILSLVNEGNIDKIIEFCKKA